MDELKKPSWRNFDAYIDALNKPVVKNGVTDELAKKYDSTSALKFGTTAKEEADKMLSKMMYDTRVFDLSDHKYWLCSFIGICAFLLLEFTLFIGLDINKYRVTIIMIFVILVLVIIYLVFICYIFYEHDNIPKYLKNVKETTLRSIPVGIIGFGLLLTNFYLVLISGYSSSPFMPALFFIALTIIGAPRENSWLIILLTILSILFVIIPYLFPRQNIRQPDTLVNLINFSTFIFSVIMIIALRHFSSKKLSKI